jgi:UDP-2,3-diacylglucosamine pyrophosphatase LpxH
VSDLHLADGRDPRTGRFARLEGFFYDDEFHGFVRHCLADAGDEPATLILNGDVFDFLSVIAIPTWQERRELGFAVSRFEHKYGLLSSERKAVWKLERIMRGHRTFFEALLTWIAAGHPLVIIRGNHDMELFWNAVQERFVGQLEEFARTMPGGPTEERIRAAISIHHWFYHEPGRIFVEHGHQYEESNCVPNLLQPVAPQNPLGLHEVVLDYPAGSYFLEIVFNRLRVVDPVGTRILTFEEYSRLLNKNRLLDVVLAFWRNLPFLIRMLKNFQLVERRERRSIRARHDEKLERLEEETGLKGRLRELDALKACGDAATKYAIGAKLLKPVLFKAFIAVAAAVVGVSAYVSFQALVAAVGAPGQAVGMRVLVSAVVGLAVFAGVAIGFFTLYRKVSRESVRMLDEFRAAAVAVTRVMDVPIVSFGHTHLPDFLRFGRDGRTYVNSGSWSFASHPTDVIKPQSQQFTFVRVVGDEPELLRWNDGASRFETVVLIEPYREQLVERLLHG